MQDLQTLFASKTRPNVLRVFLFQPEKALSAGDVAELAEVSGSTARSHARDLAEIGLIEKTGKKARAACWRLNKQSPMRQPLHDLLLQYQTVERADIRSRVAEAGDIQLLVLVGMFTGSNQQDLDMLIVTEADASEIAGAVASVEKALGAELRYCLLAPEDFRYRRNVQDKVIRDVLDGENHVLIDTNNVVVTDSRRKSA
jgi:hypothetical protein